MHAMSQLIARGVPLATLRKRLKEQETAVEMLDSHTVLLEGHAKTALVGYIVSE